MKDYNDKYSVKISHEKTKLLAYGCANIPFSNEAEHLGIIRSTVDGNLPNVLNRILAHKKAMGAILGHGLALNRRGNPSAALRVQQLYGLPVLMSGLASLVLTSSEIGLLDQHYKTSVQNLQKLHLKTPSSVIYFLGGTLPFTAILHLRYLSLFAMITRIPSDPLNHLARHVFSSLKPSSKSWFWIIRDLCVLYQLPHPLHLLDTPLSKEKFKKLAKSKVIDLWETKLRGESILFP